MQGIAMTAIITVNRTGAERARSKKCKKQITHRLVDGFNRPQTTGKRKKGQRQPSPFIVAHPRKGYTAVHRTAVSHERALASTRAYASAQKAGAFSSPICHRERQKSVVFQQVRFIARCGANPHS